MVFYGLVASGIIFVILLIVVLWDMFTHDPENVEEKGVFSIIISVLPAKVSLAVVVLVVAVPDGLPITVGVSLAFSVIKMYNDKILVRKLDAPEKMGAVDEICCGKTGTITKNDMKVARFYCQSKEVKNSRKNTLLHCELTNETIERVKEGILYNCEARVEMDATTYIPVGSGTEVGFLRFLQDAEVPVHLLIQRKLGRIRATSPFSPQRKRSAVALECPDRQGLVTVYVKGAPEVILEKCQSMLDPNGIVDFGEDERAHILEQVTNMASQPLRCLAFGYAEMTVDEWAERFAGEYNMSPDRALEDALSDGSLPLTFVGAFGLRDPLRPKVASAIRYAREKGQMSVRMVSGDHIATAGAVARKAGILLDSDLAEYAIMDAARFREEVGALVQKNFDGQIKTVVENEQNFSAVAKQLKVLARATASDKLLLVTGLQNLGYDVTVTGDGINDVEALEKAQVGLAMGSGCSAAKEASDMVLVDDDFESALRAIMWGRNIFNNVSRFLQFQVTVNISALATVLIGVLRFGESPLSPVQLLWINLIMDTFAAIGLSTEPPLPLVIEGKPFKSNVSVMTAALWRQILGLSAWNIFVMTMLMFFGQTITGVDPATDEANVLHYTYIFHTFVFLQVFNEINCRKIGKGDFHVFESFFHNVYFLAVVAGVFATQVLVCTYLPALTQTTAISRSEWGACIAVGSTSLIVAALFKFVPTALFDPLTKVFDEEKEMDSKLTQAYQGAKTTALPGEGANDGEEEGEAFSQAP